MLLAKDASRKNGGRIGMFCSVDRGKERVAGERRSPEYDDGGPGPKRDRPDIDTGDQTSRLPGNRLAYR